MLFNPKHRKIINGIMIVVGVLIVVSMIILYFPAISYNA
jgi:ABC-type multidrug transport system permease subunit